jgi:hypothetical protein
MKSEFDWPADAHVGGECINCGMKCLWDEDSNGWSPHTDTYHNLMRKRLVTHLARIIHAAAGEDVPLKNWPGYSLVARNRRYQ